MFQLNPETPPGTAVTHSPEWVASRLSTGCHTWCLVIVVAGSSISIFKIYCETVAIANLHMTSNVNMVKIRYGRVRQKWGNRNVTALYFHQIHISYCK